MTKNDDLVSYAHAVDQLKAEKHAIDNDDNEGNDSKRLKRMENVIESFDKRTKHIENPKVNPSTTTTKTLYSLGIEERGFIVMNDGLDTLVETSKKQDRAGWSSNIFNLQLKQLNESTARLFIDAYFLRLFSMFADDKEIFAYGTETIIPPTPVDAAHPDTSPVISGRTDYLAVILPLETARSFQNEPTLEIAAVYARRCLIVEAKYETDLHLHIPQAIAQLKACAEKFHKSLIRGAISSGFKWLFVILELSERDSGGGKYYRSDIIDADVYGPDRIVAILALWTQRSFEALKSDDYFRYLP
ncbi:hypothetical protein BDQ17DRAFT_1537964 [Cyathus striatus]|nr:hypothetical protein BDQ17DRAFT_1537964 [Cyathus striatus]